MSVSPEWSLIVALEKLVQVQDSLLTAHRKGCSDHHLPPSSLVKARERVEKASAKLDAAIRKQADENH